MEEGDQSIITQYKHRSSKRHKVENDTSSGDTPMDRSCYDIFHDATQMDSPCASSPVEASPSYWEPFKDELTFQEWLCEDLKSQLNRYEDLRKSIIPSLALWHHMTNLEFYFDKEDCVTKQFVTEQEFSAKMNFVEELLRNRRAVDLEIYKNWPGDSGKKFDGKHISKTGERTTIYISRAAFASLTHALWQGVKSSAHTWRNCRNIYDLIHDDITRKNRLNVEELRTYVREKHGIIGGRLVDDFIYLKYIMEPKYHPLIRQEQMHLWKYVSEYRIKKEMEMRRSHFSYFPFADFVEYSKCIRELIESKLKNSASYDNIITAVGIHREFTSAVSKMEERIKSDNWMKNLDDALLRTRLFEMCSKSLQEAETIGEHCVNKQKFVLCMLDLFKKTENDKTRVEFESKIKDLPGLHNDTENLEELQTSLKAIKDTWFHDLSDGYAVLGILLYDECAALSPDKQKEFVENVIEVMKTKSSYLYKVWRDSCLYEKIYRDRDDAARVISWSDEDAKSGIPECSWQRHLRGRVREAEDKLKKLKRC